MSAYHSRDMSTRTEQDDEADYGFRFGQLNLQDDARFAQAYSPIPFVPRPQFPTYPSHHPHAYASPLQSPYIPNQPTQSPFIPYQQWQSPPMSPMPSYARARHSSFAEEPQTPWQQYQQWSPQSYQVYTPYQPPYETPPVQNQPRGVRMSWSGPTKQEGERERKAYHPQPPARRSDWVMWVGNVPQNTSHEELWRYFNTTIPPGSDEWKGPSSIFLISRSSCAFVNLSSQEDLDRAVSFFNGRPLRSWDARCPRMVCRIRRKDDDLRAGVGAQRGTGMHREWVKAVEPPEGEGRRRESITKEIAHKSKESYASTNSSFLVRHFPRRFFILKSMTMAELEESVKTGIWRTQRHNEPILDQAYRTAPEVYLILGANKSGEFFGYAKMVEPIDKEKAAARAAKLGTMRESSLEQARSTSYSSSSSIPERGNVLSPVPMASPSSLTSGLEEDPMSDAKSLNNPKRSYDRIIAGDLRPNTLDPKVLQQSSMAGSIAAIRAAERHAMLEPGSSDRHQELDGDGVSRKDTIPTPPPNDEEEEVDPEGRGMEFRIEWVKVASLSFGRTRHLRNPWNADREVKVSRDGTEVEPNVGNQLLGEWEKLI